MARDLPKNDLPTLILAVLNDMPRHGYGIAREIEKRSENLLTMREGSLYPALRVLEQDGLIVGVWDHSGSGPARKLYQLTETGITALADRTAEFRRYTQTVERILSPRAAGGNSHAEPA